MVRPRPAAAARCACGLDLDAVNLSQPNHRPPVLHVRCVATRGAARTAQQGAHAARPAAGWEVAPVGLWRRHRVLVHLEQEGPLAQDQAVRFRHGTLLGREAGAHVKGRAADKVVHDAHREAPAAPAAQPSQLVGTDSGIRIQVEPR
eukprot:scaffold11638_cov118-Isochrysis_galbana.AAC.3